jgi:hypothetical protein
MPNRGEKKSEPYSSVSPDSAFQAQQRSPFNHVARGHHPRVSGNRQRHPLAARPA